MNRSTILLVEDNPDDAALTLRAFRKSAIEFDLVVVGDGVEALDYLFATGLYSHRNANLLPTVVFLDLKLPKLNGLEVLRYVRAHKETRNLPVIVLTSSREEQDISACYANGANSYIRKPVDFTEFTAMARVLCVYWLQFNEQPPCRGEQS